MSGATVAAIVAATGVTVPLVYLQNTSANAFSGIAAIIVHNDGFVYYTVDGFDSTFVYSYKWLLRGPVWNYDVRMTATSGTFGSGSAAGGTWLNLGSTHLWEADAGTTVSGTIEIRLASSQVVLASDNFSIQSP